MLTRIWRFITRQDLEPAAAIVEGEVISRDEPSRASFFTTDISAEGLADRPAFLARLNERAFPRTIADSYVYNPKAPGVLSKFAMDSVGGSGTGSLKATFALAQTDVPDAQAGWYASQGFIGYQMCAMIAQHWLVGKACRMPARDAIRKGYELTVNDGSNVSTDVLAALKKANKRYKLDKHAREFVEMGRIFGIRIALFVVESPDPDYYVKPFNADGIPPNSYRGISQVDPYWCVPELTDEAASDPTSLDFYEPTYWVMNGNRYHKSHLVIIRGPEVADIFKPSYLYGGVSIPQMIYERVYAAERTANEAPQLALTKRAMIFYTDAAKAMANQCSFMEKLAVWAHFRDNYGVKVADKEADKIEQHDTSLADLDTAIMTQYQIVASIAEVPVTKLMGTQLKGFSTGEGEAENYHEMLESIQTNDMEPLIDRHMVCVIRSEIAPRFGIAPFSVDCTWNELDSLDTKSAAEVRKLNAETDKIYAVDIGAVSSGEVRSRLAEDESSGFSGIPVVEEGGEPDDGE